MPQQNESLHDLDLAYQHLVDDALIRHGIGWERRLSQPVKHDDNPILYPDERASEQYLHGRPLWDESEQRFVMWYHVTLLDGETTLRYATSLDGLQWDRPSLGLYEENGSKDNNVLADEHGRKICPKACIYLNPRDEPGRKFVGIFQPWHYCYGYSPDGIRWDVDTDHPVWIRGSGDGLGECMSFMFDPVQDLWRGYVRVNIVDPVVNNANRRTIGYGESADLRSWTGPKIIYAADDDWGVGAQVYSWSPWFEDGRYWAIAEMFLTDLDPDPRLHQTLRPTLLTSADGLDWHAIEKGAFLIPLGEQGEWDGMMVSSGRPIVRGGRTLFYYSGYLHEHGSTRSPTGDDQRVGLGLAIGGQGRYAALHSRPGEEAVLLTHPFTLRGDQLSINARTHGDGRVRSEILDSGGSIVVGVGSEGDCDAFRGDATDSVMTWQGDASACRKVLGESVRLRLRWRDAELFGFQFRASGPDVAELASGPAPLSCGRTTTPPVIDGRLDDEVWENYAVIGMIDRFVAHDRVEPAPVATIAYVTRDDDALYFAFNAQEPDTDRLKGDCVQGETRVFDDDALQIELQPSGEADGPLMALIVSCRAVRTTISIDPKHAHSSRHDLNPAWEAATSVADGCWNAEVRVPFAYLDAAPPDPGDRWRLNLHRFRWAGRSSAEIHSWVCTFGQFWRNDRRGLLKFT